jgi:hypothetical protein
MKPCLQTYRDNIVLKVFNNGVLDRISGLKREGGKTA